MQLTLLSLIAAISAATTAPPNYYITTTSVLSTPTALPAHKRKCRHHQALPLDSQYPTGTVGNHKKKCRHHNSHATTTYRAQAAPRVTSTFRTTSTKRATTTTAFRTTTTAWQPQPTARAALFAPKQEAAEAAEPPQPKVPRFPSFPKLPFRKPQDYNVASSPNDFGCLAAHNTFRAMEGVGPMTWSDSVASKAKNWANTLFHQKKFGVKLRIQAVKNI